MPGGTRVEGEKEKWTGSSCSLQGKVDLCCLKVKSSEEKSYINNMYIYGRVSQISKRPPTADLLHAQLLQLLLVRFPNCHECQSVASGLDLENLTKLILGDFLLSTPLLCTAVLHKQTSTIGQVGCVTGSVLPTKVSGISDFPAGFKNAGFLSFFGRLKNFLCTI